MFAQLEEGQLPAEIRTIYSSHSLWDAVFERINNTDCRYSHELATLPYSALEVNRRRIELIDYLAERAGEGDAVEYTAARFAGPLGCTENFVVTLLELSQLFRDFPLLAAVLRLRPIFNDSHLLTLASALVGIAPEKRVDFELNFLLDVLPRRNNQQLKGRYWLRRRINDILVRVDPLGVDSSGEKDPRRATQESVSFWDNPEGETGYIDIELKNHRYHQVMGAITQVAAQRGISQTDALVELMTQNTTTKVVFHVYANWYEKQAWTPEQGWLSEYATDELLKQVTALQLLSDSEVDSYQPTESQRHEVIARYGCCNFPGCTTAASKCQMDHLQEYNRGGPTATWNLHPLCTKHHRLKTLGEYTVEMDPQGTTIWRSKDGEEATSVPEGVIKDMRRLTLEERMRRKHQVRREKNEAIYGTEVQSEADEPAPF